MADDPAPRTPRPTTASTPSAMQVQTPTLPGMAPVEAFATPLPVLSMVVLAIALLGEFLTAGVATPFILFMVKGFGTLDNEPEIAFWTGILVSTFFLTQFLTAILWANIADAYGRRFALVVSLLGSGITCTIFGACTTLNAALAVRLMQGVFGGAVGVARGAISAITDESNAGRAYAILSFAWGLGGVAGAVVGGSCPCFLFVPPVWPKVFAGSIFERYPYLLPCAVAGSVTLLGSALGCLLGPDGGPRQSVQNIGEKVIVETAISPAETTNSSTVVDSLVPTAPVRIERTRTFSSTRPTLPGYGSVNQRGRLASGFNTRRGSIGSSISAFRRPRPPTTDAESSNRDSRRASFAHRLVIANENNTTNMAELWVAAAINSDGGTDNEGVFAFDGDWDEEAVDSRFDDNATETDSLLFGSNAVRGRRISRSTNQSIVASSPLRPLSFRRPSNIGTIMRPPRLPSSPLSVSITAGLRRPSFMQPLEGTPTSRRFSGVPNIFNNAGVGAPPAMLESPFVAPESSTLAPSDSLQPIIETRRLSIHETPTWHSYADSGSAQAEDESVASKLPIMIIAQYGMLALHATTHDQVFLSYLVSDYEAGGLELKAGDYAQLIAVMCFAQLVYQFVMYPNIGPPYGPCSHLTMFRLGSALFIPAYLCVTLLRPLVTPGDANPLLMLALGTATAVRFCGSCFAYTAVSILLNYMTPPSAIGLANGLAQSIVSLARCFGPVLGGWLWSASTENDSSGFPIGFLACAGVCAAAILQSFMIR
ncbi:hypothetical protein HMN09_00232900 [Mycena chlorophos]|uniref:Major facilitator superfamily MFS-1 n=1 Tax=Mycena chlorophos TaxID=658473 RepID=A0A8H6WNP9_MYCCL|nr:hypothetical protein HMN09_00232900 [Mycena chlorophos]